MKQSMKKAPVRGMRDMLPSDMLIREYLLSIIEETAMSAGFQKIETPAIEHLENLSSKQGGENESLIFKILKRGQSYERALKSGDDLTDSALRYDLTVPLARYVAANASSIPSPFKALQIGPVWRADAPQKGRLRQFLQCDMDIIGDPSVLAEVDIITTTVKILSKICAEAGVTGLTVHLNDRRLLLAATAYAGFDASEYGSVLISLDKNDKIGLDGVKQELYDQGYEAASIEKLMALFDGVDEGISIAEFCEPLGNGSVDQSVLDDLEVIVSTVGTIEGAKIVFSPTLVRGMGYYTGPIFECSADGLGSSIAGGGRYDEMIGKFGSGAEVPACGFSIGFERLVAILGDLGFTPPVEGERVVILVDRKVSPDRFVEILNDAEQLRQTSAVVSVLPMSRNLRHQVEVLEKNGYTDFRKIYS